MIRPSVAERLQRHAEDPSPLLEAAFCRIEAERMAGVPVLHPALRVEAIGFSLSRDGWLGVLVTPWFMNVMLVPGPEGEWRSAADGERVFRRFPSGDYAFLGGYEPEIGEYQSCALFSPMAQFSDQTGVRAVALAALEALRREPPAVRPATPGGDALDDSGQAAPGRPMSKREFLGAMFRRG